MKKIILCLIAIWLIASSVVAQQRGGTISNQVDQAVSALEYHALVIGINQYSGGIPSLVTSVNDARAVKDVLVGKFGFAPQNVVELFDSAATRSNILRALRELSISLDENDALVIYFAGHGVEDPATVTGYWIPTDAIANAYDTYISNGDIRTFLRAIKARHIFLISDSCFSGTLLAQRSMAGEIDERFYAKKAASRSRVVLTSGGNEPVMDAGKSGHSVFGYFFLKSLRDYEKPYLIPTQIFVEVGPLVANNAPQTPQWGSLREAMDEGGEIVFINQKYKAPSFLSFQSNKPAKVYLDGAYIGDTPIASIEASPGTHSYKLACAEYCAEQSGELILQSGHTETINFAFSPPKDGFLTVYSEPWSYVYLNSKKIGETPIIGKNIPPGRYIIKLENEEFNFLEGQEITIEPGKAFQFIRKPKK